MNNHNYIKLYDTNMVPTIIENNKIKIFIDPLSEIYLFGTTIDYIYENYDKSIFENKFIFLPDKDIATSCGCGVSFSPKK